MQFENQIQMILFIYDIELHLLKEILTLVGDMTSCQVKSILDFPLSKIPFEIRDIRKLGWTSNKEL